MRKTLIAAAILSLGLIPTLLCAADNPVASKDAQVICGNARFTVLTERLIRMEWSEKASFEDHATLAIVNRNLPVPKFTVQRKGEGVVIKTSALTLTYTGGGAFTASNLSASFKMNGKTVVWNPSLEPTGNLMGTARTLDGCSGPDKINYSDPWETGILSRDGWAVVDESERHIFVDSPTDWKQWVDVRPEGKVQDLYLFAYGHDYKGALGDFIKVAGRIPMPPKYVFGYWWSKYWAYSDEEFLSLAGEFRSRHLPIDIMVIDMDWHYTWPYTGKREYKNYDDWGSGWTGYSWNRDLFPDPEGFLDELHSMKLKTSLNLHPADGISVREDCYTDFVKDYLSRTSDYDGPEGYIYKEGDKHPDGKPVKAGYRAKVPYRLDQVEWADAYFNSVLNPIERQGIDFWWLDWQQYKESRYVKGLSNTFWLNHIFFNEKVRRQATSAPEDIARPLIYHRWGGLGSHRYQLGFSGDTQIKWEVLGFLPYFTATASNVGYGYWGHDLGGHWMEKESYTDPELYTRWLQYGVFSPIFKTHSTTSALFERRFWAFPDHYRYMRDALELRYALTPYIYDASRQAYETGVSMCRPLYYEYPEDERAYSWKEEYFFGDNILAATICEPMGEDGTASRSVWFPSRNDWYDMAHHKMIRGGTTATLQYTIAQNAWFVKAGAIIPLAEEGIQNLQDKTNKYRIYVAPGKGHSEYVHYEDDGMSQAYPDAFAKTVISKTSSASSLTLEIGPREGSYKGMDAQRNISVILGGLQRKPSSVTLEGKGLEVNYDPETLEATFTIPAHDAAHTKKLSVKF